MLHNLLTMRSAILALSLSAIILSPKAMAQENNNLTLSANVNLTSDYRFRGISFSNKDIAVQGGLDIASSSGFYVGTWASSIDSFAGSETELDIYGGFSGEAGQIVYDIGLLAYTYPGSLGTSYLEAYASISGEVGKLAWSLGSAYSFSQENIGNQDNIYVYTDNSYQLVDGGLSLTAHLGLEDGAFGDSKWDWSAGVNIPINVNERQISIDIQYVDTNLVAPTDGSTDLGGATALVFLGVSF